MASLPSRSERSSKKRPSSLLIIREWGLISFQALKQQHLADIARLAAEGFQLATGTEVELAQLSAEEMKPKGRQSSRTTALGVWFKGKPAPPQDGLMRVGQGVGLKTVELSPTPLSFAPKQGSRGHAALCMPGWRFDFERSCMTNEPPLRKAVERGRHQSRQLSGSGKGGDGGTGGGPSPGPAGGKGSGAHGSGVGPGSPPPPRRALPSMAEQREKWLSKMAEPERTAFLAAEVEASKTWNSDPSSPVCCYAVKFELAGHNPFACRPGQGCRNTDRSGGPLEPCIALDVPASTPELRSSAPERSSASALASGSGSIADTAAGDTTAAAAEATAVGADAVSLEDAASLDVCLEGGDAAIADPAEVGAAMEVDAAALVAQQNAEWLALMAQTLKVQMALIGLTVPSFDEAGKQAAAQAALKPVLDSVADHGRMFVRGWGWMAVSQRPNKPCMHTTKHARGLLRKLCRAARNLHAARDTCEVLVLAETNCPHGPSTDAAP